MAEKIHLSKEQKSEQIEAVKKIEVLTASIAEQIKNLHAKACITAFTNSVENLNKKCEIYGKETVSVSPDEKRIMKEGAQKALAEFRAKNQKEISSNGETNTTTETDEFISEVSESEMGTKSKKGKRH